MVWRSAAGQRPSSPWGSDPRGEDAGGGRLNCFRGEEVPVSDGSVYPSPSLPPPHSATITPLGCGGFRALYKHSFIQSFIHSGEERVLALVGAAVDSGELSVVASPGSGVEVLASDVDLLGLGLVEGRWTYRFTDQGQPRRHRP